MSGSADLCIGHLDHALSPNSCTALRACPYNVKPLISHPTRLTCFLSSPADNTDIAVRRSSQSSISLFQHISPNTTNTITMKGSMFMLAAGAVAVAAQDISSLPKCGVSRPALTSIIQRDRRTSSRRHQCLAHIAVSRQWATFVAYDVASFHGFTY